MHSFVEASSADGRVVARLDGTTRLVVLLMVASMIMAACSGGEAGVTGTESDSSTVADSPSGQQDDADDESSVPSPDRAVEVLAARGSGSDIIMLGELLPTEDAFGSDWVEIGSPTLEELLPCEKPPVRTAVGRIFASFSPDSLIAKQINLHVIDLSDETDAIDLLDTIIGEGADDCDVASADMLETRLAESSGGAYSLDRSTVVGETTEPLIELPDGFDDIGARSYEVRYLGDSGDIELAGDLTVLRRGTLVLVAADLAPAGTERNDTASGIFVDFAIDLADRGWGDQTEADTSVGGGEELDAAAEVLTAMMGLDDDVPQRFESLFLGDLRAPSEQPECDEPDPTELVAASEGPAWHATSAQIGENLVQRGYVFVSAASAKNFADRLRDDETCFAELNLLTRQQLQLPVTEVEVSLHNTVVDEVDVLEMRATGIQTLADVELDVVNSIFVAQAGDTVALTLYIGLLGDQQEVANFTAAAAQRGAEGS